MNSSSAQTNGSEMTGEERIKLITTNLQEVLNPEIMEDIILKEKRPLTIYWGMLESSSVNESRIRCPQFAATL